MYSLTHHHTLKELKTKIYSLAHSLILSIRRFENYTWSTGAEYLQMHTGECTPAYVEKWDCEDGSGNCEMSTRTLSAATKYVTYTSDALITTYPCNYMSIAPTPVSTLTDRIISQPANPAQAPYLSVYLCLPISQSIYVSAPHYHLDLLLL